jgi:hypothetical protein
VQPAHQIRTGLVDWSKCDACCFSFRPFDRPLCFCRGRKGASLQTAKCHRWSQPRCGPTLCSSQPKCGPTLSTGPPRPDPWLQRPLQIWRRLICGDLKGSGVPYPLVLAPFHPLSSEWSLLIFTSGPFWFLDHYGAGLSASTKIWRVGVIRTATHCYKGGRPLRTARSRNASRAAIHVRSR